MTVDLKVDTRYTDRDEESPRTPGTKTASQQNNLKKMVAVTAGLGLLLAGICLKTSSKVQETQTGEL